MVYDPPNRRTLAFINPKGYLYLIRDRISNEQVARVVMHEIGHLLGAAHTRDGLMEANFNPNCPQCIDWITLHEVALKKHLDMSHMNYCIYGDSASYPKGDNKLSEKRQVID